MLQQTVLVVLEFMDFHLLWPIYRNLNTDTILSYVQTRGQFLTKKKQVKKGTLKP